MEFLRVLSSSHLDSIVIITARRNDVEQNEEILITQQSIMARKNILN